MAENDDKTGLWELNEAIINLKARYGIPLLAKSKPIEHIVGCSKQNCCELAYNYAYV